MGNCPLAVRGVIALGQGMYPFLEVLPGLVLLVKGDAGAEEMKKCKALVSGAFHERGGDALGVAGKKTGHKGGAIGEGKERGV